MKIILPFIILSRYQLTDAVEAEEMFTKLMGEEVNPANNSSRTTPSTSAT